MLFFKVNSSRDTAAGLFRAGLVYAVQKSDARTLRAVEPHLEKGGAFAKLSEKDAMKAAAGSLVKIGPADSEVVDDQGSSKGAAKK